MFNYYQQESTNIFKPVKPLKPEHVQLLDWCLGLGGESGEVLDLIKHAVYHEDTALDKMELAKELGDVLWYVSAIATTCGIDLADVAELNRAKLNHRYNGAFSVEASANRHEAEKALKDTPIYRCLASRINNDHNAPVNVIVIGPDGSGKTTLTKQLAEITSMKYIKCDYRQEDKPELAKKLLTDNIDVIYDRFYFPDDLVYSRVQNIILEDEYLDNLCNVFPLLQQLNAIIIYVDASLETLKERSKAWADDYIQVAQLHRIKDEYKIILQMFEEDTDIPIIRVDTTDVAVSTPAYDNILRYLVNKIEEYRIKYGTAKISKKGE